MRRRRVFIAYARNQADGRDNLAKWLIAHQFEPVYDDASDEPRTVVTVKVAKLIRSADCVIVLGTRESLQRQWIKDEVEYAASLRWSPDYLPVLAEHIPESELPDWFVRKQSLLGGIEYVVWCDGDDAALSRRMNALRRGFRVTLRGAVTTALVLFLVVPLLLGWSLRPIVDTAGSEVREVQRWVEAVNADIEDYVRGRQRDVERVVLEEDADHVTAVEYRQRGTGALLAHDTFDRSRLVRRHFFRAGNEIALDLIVTVHAPNGALSQLKTRRIFPRGVAGPLIEDTFDSTGKLVSKRMRASAGEPWRYFVDRGRTIYPVYPFLAPYR